MYKVLCIFMIMFINVITLGNLDKENNIGYFHIIRNDKIETMRVYEKEQVDDETFLELSPDKSVATVELKNIDDAAINVLIAKRILDFEGETIVKTPDEYSKYGITDKTLNKFNTTTGKDYKLEELDQNQAIEIILNLMEQYRVTEIKDPRIRIVVFDTIFNTGYRRAALITQKTFNFFNDLYGDGKRISADGVIGSYTIEKLNSIKKIDLFVQLFIYERLDTYKKFRKWNQYKSGWANRIQTVGNIDFNL